MAYDKSNLVLPLRGQDQNQPQNSLREGFSRRITNFIARGSISGNSVDGRLECRGPFQSFTYGKATSNGMLQMKVPEWAIFGDEWLQLKESATNGNKYMRIPYMTELPPLPYASRNFTLFAKTVPLYEKEEEMDLTKSQVSDAEKTALNSLPKYEIKWQPKYDKTLVKDQGQARDVVIDWWQDYFIVSLDLALLDKGMLKYTFFRFNPWYATFTDSDKQKQDQTKGIWKNNNFLPADAQDDGAWRRTFVRERDDVETTFNNDLASKKLYLEEVASVKPVRYRQFCYVPLVDRKPIKLLPVPKKVDGKIYLANNAMEDVDWKLQYASDNDAALKTLVGATVFKRFLIAYPRGKYFYFYPASGGDKTPFAFDQVSLASFQETRGNIYTMFEFMVPKGNLSEECLCIITDKGEFLALTYKADSTGAFVWSVWRKDDFHAELIGKDAFVKTSKGDVLIVLRNGIYSLGAFLTGGKSRLDSFYDIKELEYCTFGKIFYSSIENLLFLELYYMSPSNLEMKSKIYVADPNIMGWTMFTLGAETAKENSTKLIDTERRDRITPSREQSALFLDSIYPLEFTSPTGKRISVVGHRYNQKIYYTHSLTTRVELDKYILYSDEVDREAIEEYDAIETECLLPKIGSRSSVPIELKSITINGISEDAILFVKYYYTNNNQPFRQRHIVTNDNTIGGLVNATLGNKFVPLGGSVYGIDKLDWQPIFKDKCNLTIDQTAVYTGVYTCGKADYVLYSVEIETASMDRR